MKFPVLVFLIKRLCRNLQMVLQLSTPANTLRNELTVKKAQLHEEGNNNSVCSTTLLDAVQWQCNTVLNEQRPIQNNPSPSIEGLGPLPTSPRSILSVYVVPNLNAGDPEA